MYESKGYLDHCACRDGYINTYAWAVAACSASLAAGTTRVTRTWATSRFGLASMQSRVPPQRTRSAPRCLAYPSELATDRRCELWYVQAEIECVHMYLLRLGSYRYVHLEMHRRPNRDLIDAVGLYWRR